MSVSAERCHLTRRAASSPAGHSASAAPLLSCAVRWCALVAAVVATERCARQAGKMAKAILGAKRKIDSRGAQLIANSNGASSDSRPPPTKRAATTQTRTDRAADGNGDSQEADDDDDEDEFMALRKELRKRGPPAATKSARSTPQVQAAQRTTKQAVRRSSGAPAAAQLFDDDEDGGEEDEDGLGTGAGRGVRLAEASDDDEAQDDEDSDDSEGSADVERAELPIERKARLLSRRQASETKEAEAELQTNIVDGERFHLPTGAEAEEERKAGVDNSQLLARINDIVGVLSSLQGQRRGRPQPQRVCESAHGRHVRLLFLPARAHHSLPRPLLAVRVPRVPRSE